LGDRSTTSTCRRRREGGTRCLRRPQRRGDRGLLAAVLSLNGEGERGGTRCLRRPQRRGDRGLLAAVLSPNSRTSRSLD
jgi:hypothetical protein